ncbi:hypothetical protein DSO57_1029256 [Entomophthora muscae]|uniref:Uncharacterized protein n=1 Tax=Entomophthora muscae TaxID=34485 RepID=A0ACC2RSB9_9FUNG|nr:hypothetical protein DSO57_1029256 [Entomophthora muscae]
MAYHAKSIKGRLGKVMEWCPLGYGTQLVLTHQAECLPATDYSQSVPLTLAGSILAREKYQPKLQGWPL